MIIGVISSFEKGKEFKVNEKGYDELEIDPMNGPVQVEPLLVEFAHQAKRLEFSDENEVFMVIRNLVSCCRVNMAKLQSIAIRRRDQVFAKRVLV